MHKIIVQNWIEFLKNFYFYNRAYGFKGKQEGDGPSYYGMTGYEKDSL